MKIVRIVIISVMILISVTACTSDPLNVVLGDSCISTPNNVFYEGLYRSERLVSEAKYYYWQFIRFFEDCTYQMGSSFSENYDKAADNIFLNEESNKSSGVYSIEGSIIKMKSDNVEMLGNINGTAINLESYSFLNKKSFQHDYKYKSVNTIEYDNDQLSN